MRARAVHTVESLLARTVEEGDCMLWTGYVTGKTPQVDDNGKTVSVRRLLHRLLGKDEKPGAPIYGNKCGVYLCVCPEHTVQRTRKQHSAMMGKAANSGPANITRKAKIMATIRGTKKLTMEIAREIREKPGAYREIAAEYGISFAMVGHIKKGTRWRDMANPFSGLCRS